MYSLRWFAVAMAAAFFFCSAAEARTRVYLQNNTSMTLAVSAAQSGTALGADRWGAGATSVGPGERREIAWFNRDTGITNGRDFYFTETVRAGTAQIPLKQRLRGTLLHSTMWQSIEGHDWYSDRNTRSRSWDLGDRQLHVRYRAYFTAGDDDIEYIFQETYGVAPGGANAFSVLAYNIYMRPTTIFKNGQSIRADLIPPQIRGYDALILSEAFDDEVRGKLLSNLRSEYPHATRILGRDGIIGQDGGVIIVSRWPIEAQDQRLFGKAATGSDSLAEKGVLYARINKSGRRYHVFGTHTQAENDGKAIQARRQQLQIIKSFIDSKNIPASEAVLIGGDLNVDKNRRDEYLEMLRILNASHPRQVGHPFTFDPSTNRLASSGDSEYLDYVLYSNAHRRPGEAYNDVRMIRSTEEWKEFFFEGALWDLSDHYAVYGRFEFPEFIAPLIPPGPIVIQRSAFIYGVEDGGALRWHRHDGALGEGKAPAPQAPKQVGTGWAQFRQVFGGGGNVIYALRHDGTLLWYTHDGFNNGAFDWQGGREVRSGWQDYEHVFSVGDGVIYAVGRDGTLNWFRHNGFASGAGTWSGPKAVGKGWDRYQRVFSGGEGVIYTVDAQGRLWLHRHHHYLNGAGPETRGAWSIPLILGSGWGNYREVFSAGDGILYAVTQDGTLRWYRHGEPGSASAARQPSVQDQVERAGAAASVKAAPRAPAAAPAPAGAASPILRAPTVPRGGAADRAVAVPRITPPAAARPRLGGTAPSEITKADATLQITQANAAWEGPWNVGTGFHRFKQVFTLMPRAPDPVR